MADRQAYPPPIRCSATAKRTGERCERWAVPGRLQCKLHGAYAGRAGRAVAEERAGATLTLAQMMANNPGRPVWEVIRDTIRAVDLLFQAAQNEVAAGHVSADSLDRMASLARQAHAMAASAVAAKALEMEAQAADRWGDVMVDRLIVLVEDWLGLPSGSNAVMAAISATLGALDLNAGRVRPPAPDGPPLMDQVGHALATVLAARLGLSPAALAAWHRIVVQEVAEGRPAPALPGGPVAALPAAPVVDAEPSTLQSAGSSVVPGHEPEAAQSVLATLAEAELVDEEPEIVDAEILDDEPGPEIVDAEVQPPRIFDQERRIYVRNPRYVRRTGGTGDTTALGYRGAEPTMPTSYREFR